MRGTVCFLAIPGLLLFSACAPDGGFVVQRVCVCSGDPNIIGECQGVDNTVNCESVAAAECVATTTIKDFNEAFTPCTVAAEQGDTEAQHRLGMMYDFGYGITEDDVRAFMWLNLSVAQGNYLATNDRENLRKRMTPEQIAEAQRLTSEWLGKFKAR